ncbi:MAG: FxsA family protein [Gammaproteobacteria bacterium]|nr:FxsA family protein [Gammaproteobacteria bacterium]
MRIGRILFLAFLLIPLLEIYLLIRVGSVIGAWPTILAVVGTAALGAYLVRTQGLATLRRAQASLDAGQAPAFEVFEGTLLLIAGALLLTPGFFTDAVGFLFLTPALRRRLFATIASRITVRQGGPGGPQERGGGGPRVIEGEYTRDDPP